jgi:cystathionine beta-lyase
MQRLVPEVGVSAFVALRASLSEGEPWRIALLAQLCRNRDRLSAALRALGLPHTHPVTSFLTWFDARALAASVGSPVRYFEQHGLGFSDGADFGTPGYLRFNFGLPPSQLDEALDRLARAMHAIPAHA